VRGSSFHYSRCLLADKYGFGLGEMKVLPLQLSSNAAAAPKGETVDAAFRLMEDDGAKLLGWVGDETRWQLGAVCCADSEYHDVILAEVMDGKAPINDATKSLLEIISKYTNLPINQVVGNCAYIDPDGKLDVRNVANRIGRLQDQGVVDKGFTADAIMAKDYVKPD